MGAAAIRVDALAETDVRAVVVGDDRAAGVDQVLRLDLAQRFLEFLVAFEMLEVIVDPHALEAVRRVDGRAAAFDGGLDGVHQAVPSRSGSCGQTSAEDAESTCG